MELSSPPTYWIGLLTVGSSGSSREKTLSGAAGMTEHLIDRGRASGYAGGDAAVETEHTRCMHAIQAAHAFDGDRFLPGGATVLVDGDVIGGVEPGGFEPPEGVEVTSYDGTLLPGLIDAHVHLVSDGSMGALERAGTADDATLDATIETALHDQVAAGVTTVRDLGDVGYRTLAWRDRAEAGLPRIVAAGPPLTTPGGHCHFLGAEASGVDGVRAAVAEHTARGVDVVKVMASGGMLTVGSDVFGVQFTADELRAAVDAAHDAGLRLLAHAHSLAGIEHALAAGVDGIEHFSCLAETGASWSDELLARVAAAAWSSGRHTGSIPTACSPGSRCPRRCVRSSSGSGCVPTRCAGVGPSSSSGSAHTGSRSAAAWTPVQRRPSRTARSGLPSTGSPTATRSPRRSPRRRRSRPSSAASAR